MLAPQTDSLVGLSFVGSPHALDNASTLYASEAMEPSPSPPVLAEGMQPYTLQWFLEIENQRHSRHARWIPRLLEFNKHAGETLLGMGEGLGTDWLQYARNGASVVVCGQTADQLRLVRRNFELRNLDGRFVHARPDGLPLESASIDVACVSGLLDQVGEPRTIVDEIYRVLKPGGKIIAVTPSKYDVVFWERMLFPWKRWLTTSESGTKEANSRFSARRFSRLFVQFSEHRLYKRHLRRSLVPHAWRWMPLALLERLIGQQLILKAFKPISVAMEHRRLAA
jgi:ubiquinone/menaquinone biosynthesis C-methylase UbiE